MSYQDEGSYKVIFINNAGEVLDQLDCNDLLEIDSESTGMDGIFEPLTTVVFLPDDTVSIQVHHRI